MIKLAIYPENVDTVFLNFYHVKDNFCFKDFEIPELRHINLFTGKNGVGKSLLFNEMMLHLKERGAFIYDVEEMVDRLGDDFKKIIFTSKERCILSALQIVNPAIECFTFLDGVVYVKLKSIEGVIPICTLGNGVRYVFRLVYALVQDDIKQIFVDNIERDLHYSVFDPLWKLLLQAAQDYNVQIFTITQNIDCIKGFVQSLTKSNNHLVSFYRISKKESDKSSWVAYTLADLISCYNHDVDMR